MNTLEAIAGRRSIRKFADRPVPRELLEKVLAATTQAPSGKNRQPWRFVVVEPPHRGEMIAIMRDAIRNVKEAGKDPGSSEWTADVMERVPVTIFVFNADTESANPDEGGNVVDIQSIGGAIQTMLLAAHDLGLGTLWICDVFYAYRELQQWLGRREQMVAAVSLGFADEAPAPRPRRPWQEVTTWFGS